MRGPIDFIIIEFKKIKFKGEIVKALDRAVSDGTIAVLDLVLITKDKTGNITEIELNNIDDEIIAGFVKANDLKGGIVSDDDIAEVADLLEPDTAAGLLVIEHLWAKDLKKAIVSAGGQLMAEGRIHPDAEAELNKGDK